jgi:hypothetical protein
MASVRAGVSAFPSDLSLFVGLHDKTHFVCNAWAPDGAGNRHNAEIYVVLHYASTVWTAVYRVVKDGQLHRQAIHVERTFPGDQTSIAQEWARKKFTPSSSGKSTWRDRKFW